MKTSGHGLHKLRRAMVRPGRDRIPVNVQVHESWTSVDEEKAKEEEGQKENSSVAIAVEDKPSDGIGRIRLEHVANASAIKALGCSCSSIDCSMEHYCNRRLVSQTKSSRHWGSKTTSASFHGDLSLPHLTASLLKRWLLGNLSRRSQAHFYLADYLDEYTFRFNRHTSGQRG